MLRRLKIDAAVFPKNIAPFFTGCRCYIIIHDLAYFDRSLKAYPLLDTMYMRAAVPRSVEKASAVFAVSEHTKNDIVRYTGCNPEKIVVIYEAADEAYRVISDVSVLNSVRKKYNLPEKFILYTGSLSPRKNVLTLLYAFNCIRNRIPHHLVLTGSRTWRHAPVHQTIEELNLSERVKKLGYVDPGDMPALYNLADAHVYPSLYEGFGLPVLEAMQCGCPVIASNATSIPEVADEAALLVEPMDRISMAEAIYNVLTDNHLRQKLIEAGFARARQFSWRKTAEIMFNTIRGIADA
jgi:glycosyltransferase involved in cell wall biosynthesis